MDKENEKLWQDLTSLLAGEKVIRFYKIHQTDEESVATRIRKRVASNVTDFTSGGRRPSVHILEHLVGGGGGSREARKGQGVFDTQLNEGKPRIVVLTVKSKRKGKVHLIKKSHSGVLVSKNSWSLDDLKSLQLVEDSHIQVSFGNKTHEWDFDDMGLSYKFLQTILKLCQKYSKKSPKLINFTEAEISEKLLQLNISSDVDVRETLASGRSETFPDSLNELEKAPQVDEVATSPTKIDEGFPEFDWSAITEVNLGEDLTGALEVRLYDELSALEAANVHAMIESDDQVGLVIKKIDFALEQLEDLENCLVYYESQLGIVSIDIQQIENKNKGVQIQAKNQKLLFHELTTILTQTSLPESTVKILRVQSMDQPSDIRLIVDAAKKLQDILQMKLEDLHELVSIQDRLEELKIQSDSLSKRIFDYLFSRFTFECESLIINESRVSQRAQGHFLPHDALYKSLIPYKALFLWLIEMDFQKFADLQTHYIECKRKCFQNEFREFVEAIRTNIHRRYSTDPDFAFALAIPSPTASVFGPNTHSRKSSRHDASFSSLSDGGKGRRSSNASQQFSENSSGIEPFSSILQEVLPVIIREQTFCIDYFMLGYSGQFKDVIVPTTYNSVAEEAFAKITEGRLQKKLNFITESIFKEVAQDLFQVIEYIIKYDSSPLVAMLNTIDNSLKNEKNTISEYIKVLLETIQTRLDAYFKRYMDDQIKAVSDVKLTTKKRNGLLHSIRVFPRFVIRVEKVLERTTENTHTRLLVNKCYENLVKEIFNSLGLIAQNYDPAGDKEKEQLNNHILHLENMHHFFEQLSNYEGSCLDVYIKQARGMYEYHLTSYVNIVIRRPLGKLLEFFEGVEELIRTHTPEEVGFHPVYNRNGLRKVVFQYSGREIRKNLDVLYKRVGKHFTPEEGMLQIVWNSIHGSFIQQHERFIELIRKCYPDSEIKLDFSIGDLSSFFSTIAKHSSL